MADAIDRAGQPARMIGPEAHRTASLEVHRGDFAVDANAVALEEDARAGFELLAWVNKGAPFLDASRAGIRDSGSGIRWLPVQQQAFDRARAEAPTVIFFDEIDALARSRDMAHEATHRMVSTLSRSSRSPRSASGVGPRTYNQRHRKRHRGDVSSACCRAFTKHACCGKSRPAVWSSGSGRSDMWGERGEQQAHRDGAGRGRRGERLATISK